MKHGWRRLIRLKNPIRLTLEEEIKKSRRARDRIDKVYSAEVEKLKGEKASADKIDQTYAAWSGEHEIEEYNMDRLLTRKMRRDADKFDAALPDLPVYSKHDSDWEQNEHWYRNPLDQNFSLTRRGRDYLDDAIWKKEDRRHNRQTRWLTLGIGFVGTLTGLVSVTATNWGKLTAMFGRIWAHLSH